MSSVLSLPYRTADAKREFDAWSKSYDRTLLQHLFFEPAHDLLLGMIGPRDQKVLDIGCGTGRFAARVLDRFARTRVWGLDLSDGMLEQGRSRCESASGRLHLVQASSERLPFADNSFDVVTCTHSFHHYPDQKQAIAEMFRVLRPGGRLLLVDGDRDRLWGRLLFDVFVVLMEGPVRHLSGRAFRELYSSAGFDNVCQLRRGGLLPFLLNVGQAAKPASISQGRRLAA
jgi:ubiquinone/menaquinone biosynthesis C-methylase UbiE